MLISINQVKTDELFIKTYWRREELDKVLDKQINPHYLDELN